MPGQSRLRIELLGGFRIIVDTVPSVRLPSVRQQQILAYLLIHANGTPIPRQRVSGSLWPDSTDVQALTNLRRELHHLRDDWPALHALLDARARVLAWRSDARATTDLLAFESAATRGLAGDGAALREAADLYRGDLLAGNDAEWIDGHREHFRQRAHDVLSALVARLEEDRAFADAIQYAQRLTRLDPLDEQAWCALMRSHARRGERATALHLYQQCAALFKRELGVQPSAATRQTYREILDLDTSAPATPAAPRTAVYPLVGRQPEWRTLLASWRAAGSGRARLCVIRGEAGIGKTRLAEELVDWARANGLAWVKARCYPGEGRLAYAPIATWLKCETVQSVIARLETAWQTEVARLRPDIVPVHAGAATPDPQLESWQRLRFFEGLAHTFRAAAPIVLIVDDLQWSDGDTLEWLQYFLRSASDTRCMVVATVRAGEEQDNPALVRMLRAFESEDLLSSITLGPLDRTATAQLAGEVLEQSVDGEALARIFQETEGHPLFIIERGRMGTGDREGGPPRGMSQVQAVVAARLGLLSEEARAAAEVAAAVGRDFTFDILAAATDLEEDTLVRALDELWRRQIVRVQDEQRWDFSHDRIREVAYNGIGPARRRLIHRRIAQAMELLYASRLDEVSASLAMHLERGGQPVRAIAFLERAAGVATRLLATEEAIRCLVDALALLEKLPPGRDRDTSELGIRSILSAALNSGRGYAALEVEQNLERIFTLSRAEGQPLPVRWLWVAFTLRYMLGDLKTTRAVSEEALARSIDDPSCRCEAHHAMGGTLLSMGELEASRVHFDASLVAYDETHPQRSALGSDLGVFTHAWSSHTLWLLGETDAALERAGQGIALAERLDHTYSRALALAYAALLHQLCGDAASTASSAAEVVALCNRYGFAYYGDWAQILLGWARGLESPAAGIDTIVPALDRLDRQRARARRPYYLSLLADTYERRGDRAQSRTLIDSAIAIALEGGETWWLPALYLQKSEILVDQHERAASVGQALDLARVQGNRALERRIIASAAAHPG